MKRTMKIVYACLIIGGLSGCGESKKDQGNEGPVAGAQNVAREGMGELSYSSESLTPARVLSFNKDGKNGSVYCEKTSSSEAMISMGTFLDTSAGLNRTIPLTGLTVKFVGVAEPGEAKLKEAFFNADSTFPSSPQCRVVSEGLKESVLNGTIECLDNIERAEWGWLMIKAKFSCPM